MRLIDGLEEKRLNFISTACYLKLKVTNCGAAKIYKSIYKKEDEYKVPSKSHREKRKNTKEIAT